MFGFTTRRSTVPTERPCQLLFVIRDPLAENFNLRRKNYFDIYVLQCLKMQMR